MFPPRDWREKKQEQSVKINPHTHFHSFYCKTSIYPDKNEELQVVLNDSINRWKYASAAHGNVPDLLTSQVPQLLDQSSEEFCLLLWKLQNQTGQQRLQLRQVTSGSHPNAYRATSKLTSKPEVPTSLTKRLPTVRGLSDLEELRDSGWRYDQRVKNSLELHIWTFNTNRDNKQLTGSEDATSTFFSQVPPAFRASFL